MALADFQVSYNGLTIGDGTAYDIGTEEGLSSWDVRTSDEDLPNAWGSSPGVDEANARKVHLTVEMLNTPAVVTAFDAAFLPAEQTLLTLGAKFPEYEEWAMSARCRARSRKRTIDMINGVVACDLQLVLHDPRCYSAALLSSAVPVFSAGGEGWELSLGAGTDKAADLTLGAGADLAFDFVGVTSSGIVIVTNAGNVDTYPTFVFSPGGTQLNDWQITNLTTGEVLQIVTPLSVGATCTADMAAAATPKGGAPIVVSGTSRYGAWQQPRTPLRLVPGNNQLRFELNSGGDSAASTLVSWRNAYL